MSRKLKNVNTIVTKKVFCIVMTLVLILTIGINTNTNVSAKTKSKTYKIAYILNGGKNNKNNTKTYQSSKGKKLYSPTKNKYLFKGWYKDKKFTKQISEIKKGTKGKLKLYAKWQALSQPLNINYEGTNDMIWSWWYYPQVVSYNKTQNNVYWGFTTSKGYSGIASYNNITHKTNKTLLKKVSQSDVDDHNGVAVTIMNNGKIMCAYTGGHNIDNKLHIRISDKKENIEKFNKDIVLSSSGKVCYSQIIKYRNKYYIFYRVNNKSWAYRYSSNGTKWSAEKIIITAKMQYYCKFMPTTINGVIRICMTSNPGSSDPNIRMGFIHLSNKAIYNSNNKTKLGTSNISATKFNTIIKNVSGKTQRLFDVAITTPNKPLVLFTSFSNKTKAKNSVYYVFDTNKTIKICNGGNPLWNPKYQLGASFVGNNKIVVAREEHGYDKIELYNYSSGNITLNNSVYSEAIGSNYIRNGRPIVDINNKFILWHRGFYNPNLYTDFLTEARIYNLL